MNNQSPKSFLKRFLDLDFIRVLGFIADMLAISSALWAINFPNPGAALSKFLSPWFLLVIWTMASYTYLCILHDYWSKTKLEYKWSSKFLGFLSYNLLVSFNRPWLLAAPLFLACIFFYIIYRTLGGWAIFIALLILFIPAFITIMVLVESIDPAQREKAYWENKPTIDENWKTIRTAIKKKLINRQWLTDDEIKDILLVKGIDRELVEYVFSRYASEYSDQTAYGNVLKRRPNDPELGDYYAYRVLVNKDVLDDEKYFHQ